MPNYLALLDSVYQSSEPSKSSSLLRKLVSYVEKLKGIPIQILKVDYDAQYTESVLIFYDSEIKIIVSSSLNMEWSKFSIAKNLISILLRANAMHLPVDSLSREMAEIDWRKQENILEAESYIMAVTLFLYEVILNRVNGINTSDNLPEVILKNEEIISVISNEINDHLHSLTVKGNTEINA